VQRVAVRLAVDGHRADAELVQDRQALGGGQQIKRAEAKGDVLVTQKDQTAKGDNGVFDVKSNTITLTGSVGVAYAGEGAMMPEVLLRDADAAMYQAKRHGGARYVVTGDAVHRFVEPPDRSIRAAG